MTHNSILCKIINLDFRLTSKSKPKKNTFRIKRVRRVIKEDNHYFTLVLLSHKYKAKALNLCVGVTLSGPRFNEKEYLVYE